MLEGEIKGIFRALDENVDVVALTLGNRVRQEFDGVPNAQREMFFEKLGVVSDVGLKNVVGLFDYDLTMAKKSNPRNFDDAPLEAEQFGFWRQFAPMVRSVIVQTARGEAGVLGYLKQKEHEERFGSLENILLASNSGHLWKGDISSSEASAVIPIALPEFQRDPQKLSLVVGGIHSVLDGLNAWTKDESRADKYPLSIIDKREQCGAIIFQIDGEEKSPQVTGLFLEAKRLVRELPSEISSLIGDLASKADQVAVDGRAMTRGYIDFKPKGMDKGYTTGKILTELGLLSPDAVLIVAGDSKSDYPMMEIADRLAREGKIKTAICIDVGGDITKEYPEGVVDVTLKPKEDMAKAARQSESIDMYYRLMNDIQNYCGPSRDNVCGPSRKASGSSLDIA